MLLVPGRDVWVLRTHSELSPAARPALPCRQARPQFIYISYLPGFAQTLSSVHPLRCCTSRGASVARPPSFFPRPAVSPPIYPPFPKKKEVLVLI